MPLSRDFPTGDLTRQHHISTVQNGVVGRQPGTEPNVARVLVVDDDFDLLEMYRQVFEMAGFRVSTALSGEAALALSRTERPDVVLTDISMPNMDGFELISRLKETLGPATPPVVVCSAFDTTEQEALGRGAEMFLQKPASPSALVQSVEALCHGARPDEQTIAAERSYAQHERLSRLRGSEDRLRDVDHAEVAREAQPWLEWMVRYFDCGSAGLFLLEGAAVIPLVVTGPQMAGRPEPRLLHVTLAAGVETGTSLVVRDMATHPSFRRTLGRRADIASFAGVPLSTSDGVRVGALCLADPRPDRLDADSLSMMELCGRRIVAGLFEMKTRGLRPLPRQAPLLAARTFEALLASELRVARRIEEAVEVALGTLAGGVAAGACAEQLWRDSARPHLAIGALGAGRVGVYVRGPAQVVRAHAALSLERARAQGLLEAAGVAAIMSSAGLSMSAVLELAASALGIAETATIGSKVERVVVRSESGKPFA
jgi:CheY-like chemotaxis protein